MPSTLFEYLRAEKQILTLPHFFSAADLARLQPALSKADVLPAPVYKAQGGEQLSEPDRRTQLLNLPEAIYHDFAIRLRFYLPQIARHFNMSLQGFEKPAVLRYQNGDYYLPHMDWAPELETREDLKHMRPRRVSAIAFLNRQAPNPPPPNAYSGGDLSFHLYPPDVTQATEEAYPAAAGQLLLFLPRLIHEVKPVLIGQRFTMVTWFH